MIQDPQNIFALGLLVFALGFRHGFDADHLAVIDGMTRYNSGENPRLARYCGALFSLGHGLVVVFISLFVSTVAGHWKIPEWLEAFGDWTSIGFLFILGMMNLHAAMTAGPGKLVSPVGLRGKLFLKFARASSPGFVALVGALFAISFDTISQAMLFSMTAIRFGGWQDALFAGLFFMLGMLFTDGVNGLWISRLLNRADRVALFVSRMMGLVVAWISLLVAALGAARLAFPILEVWSEGKETMFGFFVIGFTAASFFVISRAASLSGAR